MVSSAAVTAIRPPAQAISCLPAGTAKGAPPALRPTLALAERVFPPQSAMRTDPNGSTPDSPLRGSSHRVCSGQAAISRPPENATGPLPVLPQEIEPISAPDLRSCSQVRPEMSREATALPSGEKATL